MRSRAPYLLLVSAVASTVAVVEPIDAWAVSRPAAAQGTATVSIEGRGNGHGVGMGQYGALGYAIDHGWATEQILAHYYSGSVAGTVDTVDVSVRLEALDDKQTAVVHDKGLLAVDGVGGSGWYSVVTRERGPSRYDVWARTDTRTCPGESEDLDAPGSPWVRIASNVPGPVTIRAKGVAVTSSDPSDHVAACRPDGGLRYYRGAIRAVNGSVGENRTINVVPLEQYLRVVVASEVPAFWATLGGGAGRRALEVQAIAARSYVMSHQRYTYARTCDSTVCQAYNGTARRSSLNGSLTVQEQPAIDDAVAATAYQVRRVGSQAGAVVLAMFSASTGGHTAPTTAAGIAAVVDDGDDTASNPYDVWTKDVQLSAIEGAWPSIGHFVTLRVLERNGLGPWGGRVLRAEVVGTAGTVSVTGDQVRIALGLRSNWFRTGSEQRCGLALAPQRNGAPSPASGFVAAAPTRLVDTRSGQGAPRQRLAATCELVVDTGLSAGTVAALVNFTTTNSAADGWITAYPCGTEPPISSAVQALRGRDVAGSTVVSVDASGAFCVTTSTTTDLVVDLQGSFHPDTGVGFAPVGPGRLYDSRSQGAAKLSAGQTVRARVGNRFAVPMSGVSAVAVNITATQASSDGWVTAWACGESAPWVSNINVRAGVDVANHSVIPVGSGGEICLRPSAPMHLVVDVSGWYGPSAEALFHALAPQRFVDTREGNFSTSFPLAGRSPVPSSGVVAMVGQVTATEVTRSGWLTMYPCAGTVPYTSVLNVEPARNVANLFVGGVDDNGRWCSAPSTSMEVIVDVLGWYSSAS
jgi:SpoIID/LytB domain protein